MGLFGSIARFITGGGAKVSLSVGEPSLSQPFPVTVSVVVEDADIKIAKVYVRIVAEENVRIHNVEVPRKGPNDTIEVIRETITGSTTGCDMTFDIAPAQTLSAKSNHEFTGVLRLPPNSLPSFNGINAQYRWRAMAGLDVSGNDPDSGWQDLDVR